MCSYVIQVLALVFYLVKFGYYKSGKYINLLVDPLVRLLDGRNDVPYRIYSKIPYGMTFSFSNPHVKIKFCP